LQQGRERAETLQFSARDIAAVFLRSSVQAGQAFARFHEGAEHFGVSFKSVIPSEPD